MIFKISESSNYNDRKPNFYYPKSYEMVDIKPNTVIDNNCIIKLRLMHHRFVVIIQKNEEIIATMIWLQDEIPDGTYRLNIEVPSNNNIELISFKRII